MSARRSEGPPPLLSVRHLAVTIPTGQGPVRAVDGVALDLDPGRTLALVGESGCGKSVLCKSILRLLPRRAVLAPATSIAFKGRELTALSERRMNAVRGREIAMILQDPASSLNPVMTIGDQITETLIHHLDLPLPEARDRARALLASVGIPEPGRYLKQHPHQLSGGQCQRVAIAIAIACQPDLLIADEPTTALDVTVQAEILDLLRRLQQERHMGLILVTHDLGVAAGRAEHIAVMYAGRIVETAPAERLFAAMRMPYTRALLDAIPDMASPPHTPLRPIPGRPPTMRGTVAGCGFTPRCERATAICHQRQPRLTPVAGGRHRFACWHPIAGGPA
jgi:peptide/nickel transport system ATP-binding protein